MVMLIISIFIIFPQGITVPIFLIKQEFPIIQLYLLRELQSQYYIFFSSTHRDLRYPNNHSSQGISVPIYIIIYIIPQNINNYLHRISIIITTGISVTPIIIVRKESHCAYLMLQI